MAHIAQINKAYVHVALNMGLSDLSSALKGTRLQAHDFDQPGLVDVPEVVRMIRNVFEQTESLNWPVLLGAHLGAASHGPVGYAMLSAPTVAEAIQTFVDWFTVRCETYVGQIEQKNERVEVTITDTTGDDVFEFVFFEALARAMEIIIQLLIGPLAPKTLTIQFKQHLQFDRRLIASDYDSDTEFGGAQNRLLIPLRIWQQVSPLYDKASYEQNVEKCRQLLEAREQEACLDLRVKNELRDHFLQATSAQVGFVEVPSLSSLCDKFHMTERTLIRKLKAANTSYRQILVNERLNSAKQLLGDARYTVNGVAEAIGYKEVANFCRAFKRWTGQSPTKFRRTRD